jgi:hypothetical protein
VPEPIFRQPTWVGAKGERLLSVRLGDLRMARTAGGETRREQSFVMRGLVMHWPSVLASANPLREGQRFVRPSRKDAGRHLCGLRNGVF